MIASLYIQTGLRNGKTYLKKVYHTTPFKIANITEDKSKPELHLMLMSSSPGILDGDEYNIKIEVAEAASLHLHTQSYQRLFNMKTSALQNMEVYMSKGSSFIYIPHPSVPHQASSFVSKNKIFLADDCSLIWGEVLTCGRKLSGEKFKFSKYNNITEVYLNKRLVLKENLLMQPLVTDVNAIGQLEGYSHQATLIYLNEASPVSELIKNISEYFIANDGIVFGITAAPVTGIIIRLLGQKAEQLYDCLKMISQKFITSKKTEHAF